MDGTPLNPVSALIWDLKYRFKQPTGTPIDLTVDDTFRRVASAVAQAEVEERRAAWSARFHDAMRRFEFLPAGRILAGAGTGRSVTLFNCFVMGRIEDDMSSIFEQVKEAALTLQQGGGIGHDFSTLRPKGAPVAGVGAEASGPVSFMDVWDAMCRTIMSAGTRRGAMMATLRCDHPDIEAFIDAKADPARLRMFNLSVLVTDKFLDAVRAARDFDLVFDGRTYRTVRARALWDRIMRAAYDYAEPGVIFIDRVNALNNLAYCETIHATNPCGEHPLPPHGACLLGSVNLARLIRHPFETHAALDQARLKSLVGTAVRFLDDVIDVSRYPLPEQATEAHAKRRIGLGVTGLADALILSGVRYGSTQAVDLAERWMGLIEEAAYKASIALAAEKGPYSLFDAEALLASPNIARLPLAIRDGIAHGGLRNGLLTSIAPTGTISLFAGNVSSGVEPVFDFLYRRRVLGPGGDAEEIEVEDFAYRLFRDRFGPEARLMPAFVTTQDLAPEDHLRMQAALQRHCDSSISKTVNCPPELVFETFKSLYDQAYALGLKGCTAYRPNPITGAVLSRIEASPADAQAPPPLAAPRASKDGQVVYMAEPLERSETLPGFTYKLRWPDSDHAIYVTLNDIVQDGRRRPFEIFINSKNLEHYAWTVALTRMISAVFRRGGDVAFVVEELKAVFDPRGGQWMEGRYVPSLLASIGDIIEKHLREIGFIREAEEPPTAARAISGSCPRCGRQALVHQEGCRTCLACGYSKCA